MKLITLYLTAALTTLCLGCVIGYEYARFQCRRQCASILPKADETIVMDNRFVDCRVVAGGDGIAMDPAPMNAGWSPDKERLVRAALAEDANFSQREPAIKAGQIHCPICKTGTLVYQIGGTMPNGPFHLRCFCDTPNCFNAFLEP